MYIYFYNYSYRYIYMYILHLHLHSSAHYSGYFVCTNLVCSSYWQVNLDGLNVNGTAMGTTPCAIGTPVSQREHHRCKSRFVELCRPSSCFPNSALSIAVRRTMSCTLSVVRLRWILSLSLAHHRREVNCCFVVRVDHHFCSDTSTPSGVSSFLHC